MGNVSARFATVQMESTWHPATRLGESWCGMLNPGVSCRRFGATNGKCGRSSTGRTENTFFQEAQIRRSASGKCLRETHWFKQPLRTRTSNGPKEIAQTRAIEIALKRHKS